MNIREMKLRNVKWIFISLACVAIGQVVWWAYLLISQQHDLASALQSVQAHERAHRFQTMIISEGIFFLCVWSVAMWSAYRSSQEERLLRRAHSDFLSAITHELKTPLANIRLALDTLERPNLTEEMRLKYIGRGQAAVSRLLTEIETVLLITHSDQHTSRAQATNLFQLVETCLSQFILAGAPQQELKIQIENQVDADLYVCVPHEELRLVIQGLLDNGLKAIQALSGDSRDKTAAQLAQLKVHTVVDPQSLNMIQLKIQDSGVGFSPEDLALAFEPFWRSELSVKSAARGTGLGLSLVKNLAARAGFEIRLESEGPGKGTTATLTLPSISPLKKEGLTS